MQRIVTALIGLAIPICNALAQGNNYPYILKTFAGAFPLGDGALATSALLYYPTAAIADAAGNLYILDCDNYRIRKVTPDGKIATFAQFFGMAYDMKMAADGTLYAGGSGGIFRVSPSGAQSMVAGTGVVGYSGDGGPAVSARVGDVYGIALDAAGNIYFTDVFAGNRVREVTTDGKIRTIAGTASTGFNGDNQPATSASLSEPSGIAVDASGNIYVADANNNRIRKFTIGGTITTVAGTGNYGKPVNGVATRSPIGWPFGLWLDAGGDLFAADTGNMVVLKISAGGTLSRVAGNLSEFGAPGDGLATSVSLDTPGNVSVDLNGNLFIVDWSHRVRKVTLDGMLTTVAGRIHFGGDGGPAVSALLNQPNEIAFGADGNTFIADGGNYRIRRVTPDGLISTWGGNGIPDISPPNGSPVAGVRLPYIYSMATDSAGNMYLGTEAQVLKVTSDAKVFVIAGTGKSGSSGDGGPATAATLWVASGIALDSAGNVYVADAGANRVRVIEAATGKIQAFAGTGTRGFGGDGGLATGAQIDIYADDIVRQTPLAVDQMGNVYIGDVNNSRVRMVSHQVISTVLGNGRFGIPADGSLAVSAPYSDAESMAVDAAGNLYIASHSNWGIDVLSGGRIRRIAGAYYGSLDDGRPALGGVFRANGMKVDANGDIYVADAGNNIIRKLILNSPVTLDISDGNNQTAQTGQTLAKPIKVQLNGRAGLGVSGVTVNFVVTSGSATLSASSSQTDKTGTAGVAVTLGVTPGTVVITATAAGTSLPAVRFTETIASGPAACAVPQPVVGSVTSAGDFGGSAVFAPGSWLEIKGTNLAQTTRQWTGDDFKGANAPTSLDGVTVTINGKSAFVAYVSPAQINVQAPAESATGAVPLVVTTASCSSASVAVQEAAAAPGLLAPSAFSVAGTQYLVATFTDGGFVGNPNLIPGVSFRPAAPGDNITAYGIGFGGTTPAVAPGTFTSAGTSVANLTVRFGSTAATVSYAGLAPGVVGLYQFNIVVPDVADGDYPITFQVGNTKTAQTVFLTVHR